MAAATDGFVAPVPCTQAAIAPRRHGRAAVHSRQVVVGPMLSGMYAHAKRTDFSVAIKSRGKPPNPWRWRFTPALDDEARVALSSDFFPITGAAFQAGKQLLLDRAIREASHP